MNPLSITEKVNMNLEGDKAKAFKVKCDNNILDDQNKRRDAIAEFVAKTYATMAIKMRKAQDEAIEKDIKFCQSYFDGNILTSFCMGLGEFKFFSMVAVECPETGETIIGCGICMSEHKLLDSMQDKVVIKHIERKINDAMQNKCENTL